MKNLKKNQAGFIPMMITLIALVIAVVTIAYMRVRSQQG